MQEAAKQDWEWKFIWKKEKINKVYGRKKTLYNNQFWLFEKSLWYTKNIIQNHINTYVVDKCLILLSTSKAYDMILSKYVTATPLNNKVKRYMYFLWMI